MTTFRLSPETRARQSRAAKLAWSSGRHPRAKAAADRRQKIAAMRAEGMTGRQIAQALGITAQTVSRLSK